MPANYRGNETKRPTVRYWRSVGMRWKLPGCSMLSPVLQASALEAHLKLSSAWRFTFVLFIKYTPKERGLTRFLPGDRKGQEGTGRWGCRGGRVHRCCGDGSGGGENAATSWPKFDFQHPGEKLSGPGEGEQPCWVSLCSPVVSPQQNAFIRGLLLQLTCLSVFAHW